MTKKLSIIIPAYNEEERIERSIGKILNYLEKNECTFEILVVDDGSTDKTAQIAANCDNRVKLVALPKNSGKGAAVRKGMLEADGDIKIFSDADLSTPIYELEKLLDCLDSGFDICIGSRAIDSELIKIHQPFYREFMGKTFNKIVQLFVIKGIKDTQCGFKGFTKQAAEAIFSQTQVDGFGFDVEALYLARKLGFKVKEIPVEWFNDGRSKVNPIVDSLKMLAEIFRIRKIHNSK